MIHPLFETLDFDMEYISRAFNDVVDWMKEINMKQEAEEFEDSMPELFAKENPFNVFDEHVFDEQVFHANPTNKMISTIYKAARAKIMEKFPEAEISYRVDGSASKFTIDDATYDRGYSERMRAYEEDNVLP